MQPLARGFVARKSAFLPAEGSWDEGLAVDSLPLPQHWDCGLALSAKLETETKKVGIMIESE